MPILHQYDDPVCNEFFNALAGTEDMSLFNNKGIKMLIEFRWPLARSYIVKRMFLPFVFFLSTFVFYMGTAYEWREDPDEFYRGLNHLFMAILIAQSSYFIGIEMYQLWNNGLDYFTSVWNYLDLIPPILLMTFIPLALNGTFDYDPALGRNKN